MFRKTPLVLEDTWSLSRSLKILVSFAGKSSRVAKQPFGGPSKIGGPYITRNDLLTFIYGTVHIDK